MIKDFVFDGQELSGFGYIICDFNGSSGTETHTVSDMSFTDIKSPLSNVSHVVATSYTDNLNRTIQIMKNPCGNDELDITNDDLSELSRWLCRKEYKLFKWVDDKDDDEVFYRVKINLKKIELAGGRVGVELDITANTPYGFTREFQFNYTHTPATLPFSTYECVSEKFDEGSYLDRTLSVLYPVKNTDIDKYTSIFAQLPEDFKDNDTYTYYIYGLSYSKNKTVAIGIEVQDFGNSHFFRVKDNYTWDSYNNNNTSIDPEIEIRGDGFKFYIKRYYYSESDGWVLDSDDTYSGTKLRSLTKTSLVSFEMCLLDTNINIYSYSEIKEKTGITSFSSTVRYDTVASALPELTIINENLPKVGNNTSTEMAINVFSDDEGYIYPNVEITIQEDGDLALVNEYENRTTYITDCKVGETITFIGGDTLQVMSSDDTHDMSSCFNYKFPRLCNKYKDFKNILSVNIACNIALKYKGIRKVGI